MKRSVLLASALALVACISTSQGMQEKVRKRASFDLDCPNGQIKITEFESVNNMGPGFTAGSWGASGCGKHATYVQVGNSGTVVMNSTGDKPAPPEPSKK
jgi:hypothetical protein